MDNNPHTCLSPHPFCFVAVVFLRVMRVRQVFEGAAGVVYEVGQNVLDIPIIPAAVEEPVVETLGGIAQAHATIWSWVHDQQTSIRTLIEWWNWVYNMKIPYTAVYAVLIASIAMMLYVIYLIVKRVRLKRKVL